MGPLNKENCKSLKSMEIGKKLKLIFKVFENKTFK